MATKPRSERETVMTMRLPRELHERVREAAKAGDGGVAAEVRRRLEQSFEAPAASADPWFGDLLDALNHAAAGAAKLRPVPKAMLTVADNEHREWLRRHHKPGPEDTTAYECFVEAAAMLFQAFAPDGLPTVTTETGMRLSYQVAARALGQIGDRGDEAFTKLPPLDQDLMERFGGPAARRLAERAERLEDEGSEP